MRLLYQPEWPERPEAAPHSVPTKIIEVVRRKEYLLMEEELVRNQEQMKPLEENPERRDQRWVS